MPYNESSSYLYDKEHSWKFQKCPLLEGPSVEMIKVYKMCPRPGKFKI